MPELAEVEYNRKQWDAGLGKPVRKVELHPDKRVFRGVDTRALLRSLTGNVLTSSETHGKQMAFQFARQVWLGLHLGMTGRLHTAQADYKAETHDHLVLRLTERTLVFSDPRQFGRVLFSEGQVVPEWWRDRPPALTGPQFTLSLVSDFLRRHGRAPIKAVLLNQEGFPGLGNWMVDEILWRCRLHPSLPAGELAAEETKLLWRTIRFVSRQALATIGQDYSDPPKSWLFPHRWKEGGRCPKDQVVLERTEVGGRTSAWCPTCQSMKPKPKPRKARENKSA